jgi:2-keto-4-pentenoate hydratase
VTDPRVLDGLHEQLESWRAELKGGARRVGWKIGLNVPAVQEALGIDECVIGFLTSATLIEDRGEYSSAGSTRLVAEPEVAIEIGEGGSIVGYAAAIELADINREFDDLQAIVAENVFHRGVIFGPSVSQLPEELTARVLIGRGEVASAEAPREFGEVAQITARLLEEAGERLEPGDRIITGSITTPVPVEAGNDVNVSVGLLGQLQVRVT